MQTKITSALRQEFRTAATHMRLMMVVFVGCIACTLGASSTLSPIALASAEELASSNRIALVIGNQRYDSASWRTLNSPESDARLIARVLHDRLNFHLIGDGPLYDANREQIAEKTETLLRSVTPETVVVFYFAGHGLQFGGKALLVPRNAPAPSAVRDPHQFVDVADDVMRPLRRAGAALSIIVIDACREEMPLIFTGRGPEIGADTASRIPPELQESILSVFSTEAGDSAYDNSPFAATLAVILPTPGIEIRQVFEQVGEAVWYKTNFHQRPTIDLPLTTAAFYLAGRSAPPSDLSLAASSGAIAAANAHNHLPNASDDENLASLTPTEALERGMKAAAAKDYAKARQLFEVAANGGIVKAMTIAGYYYSRGFAALGRDGHWHLAVARDPEKAMHWYREAAQAGDADAMNGIGALYDDKGIDFTADGRVQDRGTVADKTEAVAWYRKAAALGNAAAMSNLSVHYGNGSGVPRNMDEALRWDLKAADAGYAPSISRVAAGYAYGQGIKADPAAAYPWMVKAAASGDQGAKTWLEHAQEHIAEASPARQYRAKADRAFSEHRYTDEFAFEQKAADLGDTQAMFNLGTMFHLGRGTPRDDHETMRWYKRAADLGYVPAMIGMGDIYAKAWGVARDCSIARTWFNHAADNGDSSGILFDTPAFGGSCAGK